MKTALLPLLVVASLALTPDQAMAQIGSSARYEASELKRHFQNQAEAYEMTADGQPLTLVEQPLMQWSNPVRSQEQGSLYVWTLADRPVILASIFSYQYNEQVFCRHEMQSISDQPISAVLDGVEVWSPRTPGLKRNTITDIPPASSSSARRMARMRSIARQFSGTLRIPGKQPTQLVLKPQPVLRYQSPEKGIIDGAIFSLAIATDPEIWLVIEALKIPSGEAVWSYAAVRSHYHQLELKRNETIVWSAPMVIALQSTRAAQEPFASEPYFTFHTSSPIPAPEMLR
ncbi:hypothetical protein Enr13x_77010 [Stieleria neptunia]|uniref:Uncharacterized protein n=1 Tax=Stieleria neptunia TaxID=2527979 RepID=A0A518I3V5_9BACT|nr:hypothetical protein [Stieleria neptunia]QDV47789.1 hypothetical protein Enr13x_77010 [Stieleria neptunia]